LVEDLVHLGGVADIEHHRMRTAASRAHRVHRRDARDAVAVERDDLGARAGEGQRDGTPEAAASPGDRRHPAIQPEGGERILKGKPLDQSITSRNGKNGTLAPGAMSVALSSSTTRPSESTMEDKMPAPSRGNFLAIHVPSGPASNLARRYSRRPG